jgi:zinc/manganese transport system permease protein
LNDILLSAFILSIVLVGIHSYFGLEIIRRGIIFTDLAIGQMSAVGAAISILFLDGEYIYPVSLISALIGGYLIAYASKKTVNVEAFIGLLYAFGVSAVFIILSKTHHGMEEFYKLMAADILFTPLEEIIKVAIIYSLLGAIILLFHYKTKGFIRDLLFFVTFSVTVTSSVKLAGVLVVFAILVSPSLISLSIGRGIYLVNAWLIGTAINLIAIILSYNFDFPTGYSIVFCNAFIATAVVLLSKKMRIIENANNK